MSPEIEFEIIVDYPCTDAFELDDLRALGRFAIVQEAGGHDLKEVNVLLTTDARMRALHRDFMGIDSETDVMTFPADLEPGVAGRGGDIVISIDRAAENGRDVGNLPWEEVRFLTVHGILHLCGWDDRNDADRAAMLARQVEIIAEFRTRS